MTFSDRQAELTAIERDRRIRQHRVAQRSAEVLDTIEHCLTWVEPDGTVRLTAQAVTDLAVGLQRVRDALQGVGT